MGLSGTSHVSYPVIKTFKLAERLLNRREAIRPSPHGKRTVAMHNSEAVPARVYVAADE